jgi:hypothetical protein
MTRHNLFYEKQNHSPSGTACGRRAAPAQPGRAAHAWGECPGVRTGGEGRRPAACAGRKRGGSPATVRAGRRAAAAVTCMSMPLMVRRQPMWNSFSHWSQMSTVWSEKPSRSNSGLWHSTQLRAHGAAPGKRKTYARGQACVKGAGLLPLWKPRAKPRAAREAHTCACPQCSAGAWPGARSGYCRQAVTLAAVHATADGCRPTHAASSSMASAAMVTRATGS